MAHADDRLIDDPGFWDSYSRSESAPPEFLRRFAEKAVAEAALPNGARVLDIATGTGAVAIAAAKAGLHVLATDFSAGMVAHVESYRIPTVETRQLDGQALDLPDASFDGAFSNFGISLFDDWRAGLAEMSRVIKPGGTASVGAWQAAGGASATLLLSQLCAEMFPDLDQPSPSGGQDEMRDPGRFEAALTAAGFVDIRIILETNDAIVDEASLDDPDRLFTFSPLWPLLDAGRRSEILTAIRSRSRPVAVPSPALIGTATRP